LVLSETTVITANQSSFTVPGGYVVGQIQVFANGINLGSADYIATDGSTVLLNRGRNVNDVVRIQALTTNFYSTATYAYQATEVTASSNGQTSFSIPGGYNTGTTQVFFNGILLKNADYTASNGTTVVLASGSGVSTNSIMRIHSFRPFGTVGALPLSGGTINGNVNVIGTIQQRNVPIIGLTAAMSVALGA
jgi:hypothetical protein